jgi:hypothetical protein
MKRRLYNKAKRLYCPLSIHLCTHYIVVSCCFYYCATRKIEENDTSGCDRKNELQLPPPPAGLACGHNIDLVSLLKNVE